MSRFLWALFLPAALLLAGCLALNHEAPPTTVARVGTPAPSSERPGAEMSVTEAIPTAWLPRLVDGRTIAPGGRFRALVRL